MTEEKDTHVLVAFEDIIRENAAKLAAGESDVQVAKVLIASADGVRYDAQLRRRIASIARMFLPTETCQEKVTEEVRFLINETLRLAD